MFRCSNFLSLFHFKILRNFLLSSSYIIYFNENIGYFPVVHRYLLFFSLELLCFTYQDYIVIATLSPR